MSVVSDKVKSYGGVRNSYDVERVSRLVVPLLRERMAAVEPGPTRDMLEELLDLLALIGGVAADGSRMAFNLTADR